MFGQGFTKNLFNVSFSDGYENVTIMGDALSFPDNSSFSFLTPSWSVAHVVNISISDAVNDGGALLRFEYRPLWLAETLSTTQGPVIGGTAFSVEGRGFSSLDIFLFSFELVSEFGDVIHQIASNASFVSVTTLNCTAPIWSS